MKKIIKRGYKVRLYPNEHQIELFEKTFGCVRLIWNYSLMEKEYIYDLFKNYPDLLKSHSFKTPSHWKRDFPFLKEVDSQALATTQQELRQSMKNFYNKSHKSHKRPKYKSKKNNRVSYTTHTTNNNIRIEGNYIKLPKVGYVKLRTKRRALPDYSIIKAATISKTPTGKYYVSLRLEYEIEIKETNTFFNQADKYYPSSKICSKCGKKKKTLPLSQRVYSCECGNVINRDVNAAINIATKGMISYLTNYIEDRTASIAW